MLSEFDGVARNLFFFWQSTAEVSLSYITNIFRISMTLSAFVFPRPDHTKSALNDTGQDVRIIIINHIISDAFVTILTTKNIPKHTFQEVIAIGIICHVTGQQVHDATYQQTRNIWFPEGNTNTKGTN